jgi:hypothetical protein
MLPSGMIRRWVREDGTLERGSNTSMQNYGWSPYGVGGGVMPRIPYVDLSSFTDPEILGFLEQARCAGDASAREPGDPRAQPERQFGLSRKRGT